MTRLAIHRDTGDGFRAAGEGIEGAAAVEDHRGVGTQLLADGFGDRATIGEGQIAGADGGEVGIIGVGVAQVQRLTADIGATGIGVGVGQRFRTGKQPVGHQGNRGGAVISNRRVDGEDALVVRDDQLGQGEALRAAGGQDSAVGDVAAEGVDEVLVVREQTAGLKVQHIRVGGERDGVRADSQGTDRRPARRQGGESGLVEYAETAGRSGGSGVGGEVGRAVHRAEAVGRIVGQEVAVPGGGPGPDHAGGGDS